MEETGIYEGVVSLDRYQDHTLRVDTLWQERKSETQKYAKICKNIFSRPRYMHNPEKENKRRKLRYPYHSMKFGAFVALWTATEIFCLARAELAEVLCRLGRDVCKELYLDTAQWFS